MTSHQSKEADEFLRIHQNGVNCGVPTLMPMVSEQKLYIKGKGKISWNLSTEVTVVLFCLVARQPYLLLLCLPSLVPCRFCNVVDNTLVLFLYSKNHTLVLFILCIVDRHTYSNSQAQSTPFFQNQETTDFVDHKKLLTSHQIRT